MALEDGLSVPVVRSADEKNVVNLHGATVDLAPARSSKDAVPGQRE